MTFETVKTVLALGLVVFTVYLAWITVRGAVWEWLYNALPDEEKADLMWERMYVCCPWLWRALSFLRSEDCLIGFGVMRHSTYDLSKVPPATLEAVKELPFWEELPHAVVYLRSSEEKSFEFDLAPYRSELNLPEAGIVFGHYLMEGIGIDNLTYLYADLREDKLWLWRKTYAERARIAVQRWVGCV